MGEEDPKSSWRISTKGGAYIEGGVDTRGGDFVGRDKHVHVYPTKEAAQPPLFVGVPAMPTHFVGRKALLADMVDRLVSGEALALSAEGLPGVGKTTLAIGLAHEPAVREHFKDGVLWAGLGPQPDVMHALATWAEDFGHDLSELTTEAGRSQAMRDTIGQRRMLLVIDDAWQLEAAKWLRCGGPNCCHLLTTRDKALARAFAGRSGVEAVPVLKEDRAYELLEVQAPEACAADPATARELARAVGGLPLALELLGGYLAAPEHSTFSDLSEVALAELADPQKRIELAQKRLGAHSDREVTLKETIALSLEGLPEEGQQAFYALGAFAPKPEHFDRPAAEAVSGTNPRTLALLAARNLVEIDTDTKRFALHQTLADVARTKMDPESVSRHRDHYLALVNEDPKDWRRIEAIYGQIKHAWTGVSKTGGEKLLDMIWALHVFQERRGLWREYLAWAERGLRLAEEKGWREEFGRLLVHFGFAYNALGQREQALDYYERALPITEEVGDRAGEATTLNNIGLVYDNLGQREKALDYYERALPIQEEVGDRYGEATTLNNIGLVYNALGQREQALDYYERVLPITEEVGDRAGEATTLSNIGAVYDALGQREKALDYYERALPILEEVGNRAGEATTLNNIGLVYANLGQRERALDYYERALPIAEEVGNRAGEAMTLNNIGLVYDHLGQREKALDYYERALPIQKEVGDRAGESMTLNNIGRVYDDLGQRERALDYYERALPIAEEAGDRAGESVTRSNMAMIYRNQDQLAEALVELKKVVELDQLVQHPDLESHRAMLALVEEELAAQRNKKSKG